MRQRAEVEPSRPAGRRAERGRRARRTKAVAGALTVAVAGAVLWFGLRGDDGPGPGVGGVGEPSTLTVLAVRTDRTAFVAVVGSEGDPAPAAVSVPADLAVEIPGAGSGTIQDAARLPADVLALTVANLLGTGVAHHAVLDLDGLAAAVDAVGGVTLDDAPADGAAVAAHLRSAGPVVRELRWHEVLAALFAAGVELPAGVESDDAGAAGAALAAAGDATVSSLPVVESGDLLRTDQDALPGLLREAFGIDAPPAVGVLVLNGNGAPGMGEAVARRLVPEGFRVVASENAATFDFETTEVRVSDPSLSEAADRVRGLLGVGTVIPSEQGSGLAGIVIVVGADFLEVLDTA